MINTPAIGQRFLMILSYSSCPPIHTQIRSGPSSTAKARCEIPTLADQKCPTFFNWIDGCAEFPFSN